MHSIKPIGRVVVGYDLHGILLHDSKLKSIIAEHEFGVKIPPGMFTSKIVVQEKRLLTAEQYVFLQRVIYHNDFVGLRMPLVKGARNCIRRLAKAGFSQVIVTSNYAESLRLGLEILTKKKLLQYLEVYHTKLGQTKSAVVKELNLTYYIDDDPYKLEDLKGMVDYLVLLHQEHNARIDCSGFAKRIYSLSEFYQLVISHDKGLVYGKKRILKRHVGYSTDLKQYC